MKPCIKFLSFT